jgi:hypothetical protein
MKSYIVAICMVCVMLFPSLGHTSQPGDMYLRFLEGDVQVKTEETAEWLPASINMPLIDSDQIWVPENGRAELMLRDGTVVRLDRNSYLEILTSEDKLTQFYLATGRVYANTRLRKGDAVVFETPTTSFRAYGQSLFGIDVSENENSTLSVFQGEIYVDRDTGQMKINAGDKMAFYKKEYPRLTRIAPIDQWEQWNRRRDQEFGLSSSGRTTAYLPDELGAYSSDFERNGKWIYEQEFGYVWTPTVITAKDWSPYRVGRWVWMRGDYVWISYEPWGWAPYHYGRWAFINNRGWCWVPPARGDVYWGPGFVGWVYTPTYVSWVPLAPREIYYGHGNYGPHSVNIRNVNINTTTVNNVVYRNIHVNNAVTTLHHNAFMTGRSINGATKENLFLRDRRVMGAPDIRPERSALTPVIKNITQANRPPQQIVNRVSDERRRNNRLEQTRMQGNLPAGPIVNTPRTGQTNDRKIEVPQSSFNGPARVDQAPPVRNPNVIMGPQESREERSTRRLSELRRNAPPQNIVKEAVPQQAAPIRSTTIPEKKIPQISVNDQPARANITVPQIPKPSDSDNARSIPPLRSNSPSIAVQINPRKNEDKPVVHDMKPQEAREVRAPVRPNDIRENIPPRNTIKESLPQQAAPVRPAIVPERKIEVPERKIEIQRKVPEVPINEQRVRTEVRQQQNQKPMENVKIAPPVRLDSQATISQPPTPPQNTEKTQTTPKGEQITQRKASTENIKPEDNIKDLKKEGRTEMQQRKR